MKVINKTNTNRTILLSSFKYDYAFNIDHAVKRTKKSMIISKSKLKQ